MVDYNIADPSDTLNALAGGLRFGQQVRQIQDQNKVNALAGQLYQNPDQQQQILGQVASIDPRAAGQLGTQANANEDRQQATLVNAARLLTSAPEQYRPQIYQQMKSGLAKYIPNLPQEYDQTVADAANSIAQAYGGGTGANAVQSTYVDDQNNRVAVMRDGSRQILGKSLDQGQLINTNNGWVSASRNTAAPVAAPVTMAGGGAPSNVEAVLAQANQMARQGIPTEQVDAWVQAQLNQAPATQLRSAPTPITPYQSAQLGMSAVDDARADRALQLQEENAQAQRDQRAQAAAAKQQTAQNAISTRQAALNDVNRGVERVKSALANLNKSTLGTGPVAKYGQQYTEAGQELEAAVGAMNNSLLSLTRVPGMGAQSDLEAKIAGLRFPQLGLDENVNQRTVQGLEKFIGDLGGTARQADQQDRQELRTTTAVTGPQGRTVVRRGTLNGRPVVQYSDGTTDYAD